MTLVTYFFYAFQHIFVLIMLIFVNNATLICICQYIVVSLHRKSEMA